MEKASRRRPYSTNKREERTEQARKSVIDSMAKLVVQRKGEDIPFEDVAHHSGVPLRTVYRLFKDKRALHFDMNRHLEHYIQASVAQIEAVNLSGFIRQLFLAFDKNKGMVEAYLYSTFGSNMRRLLRKRFNYLILTKILENPKIRSNFEYDKRMALIATLYNARLWQDLREDFKYNGAQMGETMAWAVECLLRDLEKPRGK